LVFWPPKTTSAGVNFLLFTTPSQRKNRSEFKFSASFTPHQFLSSSSSLASGELRISVKEASLCAVPFSLKDSVLIKELLAVGMVNPF
jgi:hypothetical protein